MEDEPVQEALFDIEGPDEDGCVWLCDENGHRCHNLGPTDKVVAVMEKWLAAVQRPETGRTANDS